jgi:hypothetical protein
VEGARIYVQEGQGNGGWEGRKLHIDKIQYFCTSPNMVRIMKSRIMGCKGHVAPYGRKEWCTQGFFFGET